ncbi:MAG: hypothetical protein JSV18_08415 [Candidatus Bathyarchaeota archaeon]|nr:MAG: hypothetical protein JSV18_08415 [Candidatus Bathyarchaeota archaeon]
MPTASIDFTMASIAMILIVMGAIFGVNMVVSPFNGDSPPNFERYYQIGRYMLLSQGEPEDWGGGGTPSSLGFARTGEPYDLDIDKVTRLNIENVYSLNYSSLWQSLGVDDVSFRIEVEQMFSIALSLTSSQIQGDDTVYNFTASTTRGGYPIPCQVSYYVAIRNSTYSDSGSTNSSGSGPVQFTLPNSQNGTGLLIGIARTEESVVSYCVLPFTHDSGAPAQAGTFANLSPLNYTLHVDLTSGASAWNGAIFSYSYSFNLTADGSDYSIPRLLDASPLVLTLTGVNGSDHWAEWVAYPQVPLQAGADMSDDYLISDVGLVSYIVDIKGALYKFKIKFRSPAEYD